MPEATSRDRRSPALTARQVGVLLLPLLAWTVTGLSRAGSDPGADRYLYGYGFFLLLVGVEFSRGVRVRGWGWVPLGAVFLAFLVGNLARSRKRVASCGPRQAKRRLGSEPLSLPARRS